MGSLDKDGTGKIRKVVNESSAATGTYLAHQLPDQAGAYATPVGLIVLFLVSRLASRFWDITRGQIKVGGMDISKIDPETLMSLYLTESSKSPASIARSNKQWVGLACIRRGTSPS